jgi:serine protease Do
MLSVATSRDVRVLIASGASLAILGAAVGWSHAHAGESLNSSPSPLSAAAAPTSFAPIVAKVLPAVVSIEIVGHEHVRNVDFNGDPSGGDDRAIPFLFGAPFGFEAEPGESGEQDGAPHRRSTTEVHAQGSGFLISGDGYILTNNHVVEDADRITVRMADGRSLKARLVGRDPATDLAVIKVTGGPFPHVDFEDAAKPRVGDWVVAVGNPFGLGGTATAGIVSALGRADVADSPLLDYMQIDAPINRGNSGGPTFDINGRVVGVNTAIYSPSGGSVGIGFDIPANVASQIAAQIIAHGHVNHGYLGATVQAITPDLAQSLSVRPNEGVIIDAVTPDGPAERAGIHNGDILTAINGQPIHSPHDITRVVAFTEPGSRLEIAVIRQGRPTTLKAWAGVRPSEQALARLSAPPAEDGDMRGDNDGG